VFPLEFSLVTVSGILIGIFVFAFKVSLGCGLASLSRRETMFIALSYLALAILMGVIIGFIPDSVFHGLLNAGIAMHAVIALLLVSLGVITAREWNQRGHDLSRCTFWVLSFPCPACMAATFLSCSFLAGILDVVSWKIGLAVGIVFFVSILGLSELFRMRHRKPSDMGNAMIFLGLFYILSMLVIPAYLSSKVASTPSEMPSVNAVYIYGFLFGMVFLGYLGRKMGVAI
jgi:predicted transporter